MLKAGDVDLELIPYSIPYSSRGFRFAVQEHWECLRTLSDPLRPRVKDSGLRGLMTKCPN